MSEKQIVLEYVFDDRGRYLGKLVVYESQVPALLVALEADTENEMGWPKHHKKLIGWAEPEPIIEEEPPE